ncbi:hypothetical protein AGABI2DRAFT_185115 [Agaricus bisporus var. bisporus H97]|uniref:hypothetical protein n=1 Tax=Agaricus bisporus var. bisporus (strain H97 / ATCC MYA-4626 / FGSC 10389) TaxID=936046 RepID=UPI00029F674A|nr:hypothetical protein AGABI2DRAFT_185115 [Agaricus bisporus var. bisporus H97]EKV47119.1 hypothetical protein AGABI2DRAFT_185115 [Agaricus bisporus var. bisporus H97]
MMQQMPSLSPRMTFRSLGIQDHHNSWERQKVSKLAFDQNPTVALVPETSGLGIQKLGSASAKQV